MKKLTAIICLLELPEGQKGTAAIKIAGVNTYAVNLCLIVLKVFIQLRDKL